MVSRDDCLSSRVGRSCGAGNNTVWTSKLWVKRGVEVVMVISIKLEKYTNYEPLLCLSVSQSVSHCLCLSVWLAGWLAGWLAVCLAGWLAGWLPVCLCLCTVCLTVWLSLPPPPPPFLSLPLSHPRPTNDH